LGGAFDYSRFETTVNWWFPTIQKLVLGLEAQFGVIYGDNIQQVDLYQMGGILGFNGKMRGYHPGSIGQLRIGRSFFSFVSELTYPVAPNVFYLLGFFDMGNVFGNTNLYTTDPDNNTTTYNRVGKNELDNPLNEVDLTDLVKDYGVGFRLVIPMVGIMGFDFAWAMDRENRHGENISRAEGFQPNFVIQAPF
jgi:outer membrane protein insertion porin family